MAQSRCRSDGGVPRAGDGDGGCRLLPLRQTPQPRSCRVPQAHWRDCGRAHAFGTSEERHETEMQHQDVQMSARGVPESCGQAATEIPGRRSGPLPRIPLLRPHGAASFGGDGCCVPFELRSINICRHIPFYPYIYTFMYAYIPHPYIYMFISTGCITKAIWTQAWAPCLQ